MQTRSFPRRGSLALALASAFCCAAAARAVAAESPLLVRIGDPAASGIVRRGLQGAIARLERSESCRAVLDDFTTASGQPLSAVLDERGEAPDRYLAGLLFLDGSSHPRCRSGRIAAFTSPGWRVVYVYSAVLRHHLRTRPAEVQAVLIHEALHTLGLGENPPTPKQIQERVYVRCLAAGMQTAAENGPASE